MKSLKANGLVQSNFESLDYFVQLEEGVTLGDVMQPYFWIHQKSLGNARNQFPRVRVRAADGSFDLTLVIDHFEAGGAVVSIWPKFPKDTAAFEISPEAIAARDAAATQKPAMAGKVNGKTVPRVEHNGVNLWHVIGLDGSVIAKHCKTKSVAQREMRAYLSRLKIDAPDDDETETEAA